MSMDQYEDDCPGCRPAMLDIKTGKVLPNDHPMMVVTLKVWAETTKEERVGFHNVCCNNSQKREDLDPFFSVQQKIQAAILALDQKPN